MHFQNSKVQRNRFKCACVYLYTLFKRYRNNQLIEVDIVEWRSIPLMFVPITIHITFHGTVASITFLSLCIGHVILNNYYAFVAKFSNKFQFSFNGHIHTLYLRN